ncbi:MAG: carbohydrate kinase [Muricauda sp.]|nr:FGGY family carbohydrate kinase [Allomuricauda sp.]MBC31782.1 carbohydrate kinase [Allomuricauda sp.]
MYYLGIDLGSSSVKIAAIDAGNGKNVGVVQVPETEMGMHAPQKGWAEQDPETWWQLVCEGIHKIKKKTGVEAVQIKGIGIAYQMHGLVLVDHTGKPLRDAIIWCDSRAVEIGEKAYKELGTAYCDGHLLNSPANFTASKLAWVRQNEPAVFDKAKKFMLPGDYIAYRLSNTINTTVPGLSEGIFWDFKEGKVSSRLLDYFGITPELVPAITDTFGEQSTVSRQAAATCGLKAGTPILYRAGDQPNNALSLNVFNVGEVAATGGTSGVMYAVTESLSAKECSRVNNFVHVNHDKNAKRIGKLLCINGAGIQYRWLLNNLAVDSYQEMNDLAEAVSVGSDGVCVLPFGNGAERMLQNKTLGTRVLNIDLNRHDKAHLCRAALEGIAFSFVYGFEIMTSDDVVTKTIRAGNDNLFRADIFGETIATLIDKPIELYDTTGAIGAARACAVSEKGVGIFSSYLQEDYVKTFLPKKEKNPYLKAYKIWKAELESIIKK